MIFHIVERNLYPEFIKTKIMHPASLDQEGFIHCSGNKQDALDVANWLYKNTDVLVLEIDDSKTDSHIKWEKASVAGIERSFPHIYGELKLHWVVGIKQLIKDRENIYSDWENAEI